MNCELGGREPFFFVSSVSVPASVSLGLPQALSQPISTLFSVPNPSFRPAFPSVPSRPAPSPAPQSVRRACAKLACEAPHECGSLGASGMEPVCPSLCPRPLALPPPELPWGVSLPSPRLTQRASLKEQPSFSASLAVGPGNGEECAGGPWSSLSHSSHLEQTPGLARCKEGQSGGAPTWCGVHTPEHGRQMVMKRHQGSWAQ